VHTKSNPLTLRDEVAGEDRRLLRAYLDGEGNLHIDGQDLGPGTAIVSDDGEYEWFKKIRASDLPRLVEALGGAPGTPVLTLLKERFTGAGSYELERVLRTSGIPIELHVWP
jgi:hypothetical protein